MNSAIRGVLFGILTLCSSSALSQPQVSAEAATERDVYALMLLGDSPEASVMAARSVSLFYPRDRELLDLMAERLVRGRGADSNVAEAESWYAKVLGESKNARYKKVLAQSTDLNASEKVLRSIEVARQFSASSTNQTSQYEPGSIDLAKLEAEIRTRFAAPAANVGFSVKAGPSLAAIVSQFGAPTGFSTIVLKPKKHGRDPQLALHFAGAGMVVHRLLPGDGRHWFVTESFQELLPVPAVDRGAFPLAQSMASLRGEAFRDFVRSSASHLRRYPQSDDLIAMRSKAFPTPLDRAEDQGMAIAVDAVFDRRFDEEQLPAVLRELADRYDGEITKKKVASLLRRLAIAGVGKSRKRREPRD